MIVIKLEIPDEIASLLIDGVAAASNFDEKLGDTKEEWVKAVIIKQIKSIAAQGISRAAMNQARKTLEAAEIG
jgi:hypothetical protein